MENYNEIINKMLCKGRRNNDLFCAGGSITFQLDPKEQLNLSEETKQPEDIPSREKNVH